MCLESVKDADNIIYCDGGSTEECRDYIFRDLLTKKYPEVYENKFRWIENEYNQKDKGMNGIQRNFYLNYLKKNHIGEWVLVLDADEVVGDLSKIKDFINTIKPEAEDMLFSVKMRHFIGNLGFEDATTAEHFVPHRLFKIRDNLSYPEAEHSVLWVMKDGKPISEQEMAVRSSVIRTTTIWHLAYCSNVFDVRKKYLNHLKKSEMHTKEFLDSWYFSHLFGIYPATPIKAEEIPSIILKEFLIDPDKIYFMNRKTLETKHFIMSRQWLGHFKPKTVLDLGCGLGMYGFALSTYGADYQGLEVSKWAIENTIYKNLKIKHGDVRDPHDFKDFDLVLAIDILEHIEEKDLNQVLGNIKTYGKNFLFSIPWLGNPDLDKDLTHKIKKSREWWINKLTNHFKIKEVPDYFSYKNQMLMGVKNERME